MTKVRVVNLSPDKVAEVNRFGRRVSAALGKDAQRPTPTTVRNLGVQEVRQINDFGRRIVAAFKDGD